MANYKTLDGLDLDIGGFTDSVTRSKQTLEDVAKKSRGIGTKPETEEIESDSNFLKGIAKLFRDNGYEPEQPSEDNTTTVKDKVLDEYVELIKSDSIQDAMKKVSTLGESPNKVEDIYTAMDTDFVTLENQPSVDSESETLEIGQTESKGLMGRPSGETQVDRTEPPSMADEAVPTEDVTVDSKILSPAFLNAIGITGSLTEEGVQSEVKKVLKEQGMSDEEITALVDKSLASVPDADEVQPTDIPEFSEEELRLSFTEYPSSKEKAIAYANDIYPNNKKAAAALAATIKFEGMKNSVEEIGENKNYRLKKVLFANTKKAPLKRNDQKIYEILGFPKQKDDDGNIVYLERPKTVINKEVQEALNTRGIDVGKVDGIIGKNTISGIKRFQKIKGLEITGELNPETYKKLNIEYRELDHVKQPIAMHVVNNPPKFIPSDKAEEIFNIRYNDHYRSEGYKLGNVGDKKFARYRGRGPIQITGEDTYKKVGDAIGVDLIKNPDLLSTNDAVSKAAVKAYLKMKGFSNYSTPEDMIRSINPGEKDIVEKRFSTYEQYLKEI